MATRGRPQQGRRQQRPSAQKQARSRTVTKTVGNNRRPSHAEREAAIRATHLGTIKVPFPVVGKIELPPPDHLLWYLGVGALAAAEIVEWPIAILLATGKALADNRHSAALKEFGDALDEAG